MKIAITSGAPNAWLDLEHIKASFVIGVDRGALTLVEHGICPDIAIGDFDSVTESEFAKIKDSALELVQLPSEKDETDTEVALNVAMTKEATDVRIYGSLGGRIDHSLANIRLLLQFAKKGLPIRLVDERNHLMVLASGQHEINHPGLPYISFFALESTVTNLTLNRLKYPLTNYELTQDDIRCISNETTESSFFVSFDSGYLLMIFSRD